ncbi:prolyl oligopeptidase [Pseudoalteromonas ulvae UL12]|nr:prolyl oligopeptidase [Pseudoalteromonas ulvae UL12]
MKKLHLLSSALLMSTLGAANASNDDPYIWLEDVQGDKALNWVKQQNDASLAQLKAHASYQQVFDNTLSILNDKERIPYASERAGYYYNFWRDETHVRGVYRRTTFEEYQKVSPKWETVLDLDALAKQENENWVYKGMDCHYPAYQRCLLSLSRGGADATVVREFDITTRTFVKDGFSLTEAKNAISWFDENSVFVGTDFGPGSMTDSGYPGVVKLWQRGTALSEAKTLYTADKQSVSAAGYTAYDGDKAYHLIYDGTSFYTSDMYLMHEGKQVKLPIPNDADVKGLNNGKIFIGLKSAWQGFSQAEVIYTDVNDLIANKARFKSFIKPTEQVSIKGINFTKSAILVTVMEDVKNKVYRYSEQADGQWQIKQIGFPETGTVSVFNTDTDKDDFFVNYTDFLTPSSLYLVSGDDLKITKLKGAKSQFDSSQYVAEQRFATSKDGTKVPYFIVHAKNMKHNGKNPTLLYGYGGFEVSMQPYYSASIGKNWLEQGGVYVLSNIRGGGEYGPRWHQAALKENRHKAYEDFEAIAEDLIAHKVTSPKHLGIQGGSNGGLLVGAAFTRRPDLYNAVICQVPLLDMKRFNQLLAGASWMGEYGNPDIAEQWDYIKTYSPYHNLDKQTKYPKVFFTTSTRDDRVHPAHARKMVAKMKAMGHDVLYFENMEGGHAGAANNEQRAMVSSLSFAYLMDRLQ